MCRAYRKNVQDAARLSIACAGLYPDVHRSSEASPQRLAFLEQQSRPRCVQLMLGFRDFDHVAPLQRNVFRAVPGLKSRREIDSDFFGIGASRRFQAVDANVSEVGKWQLRTRAA